MLQEVYKELDYLLAHKSFSDAESILHQILQTPGQPWQQYLYLPADFYESWGDNLRPANEEAVTRYQKALQYRYQIGAYATGSGEGMEAMYHIKRIQQKMKAAAN